MEQQLPSVHPGEVLKEELLDPLGVTPYRLAKEIRVPLTRIAAILAGKRGITADTALRLGHYFGTSATFWLNLQANYELQEARRLGLESELKSIAPHPNAERANRELALA